MCTEEKPERAPLWTTDPDPFIEVAELVARSACPAARACFSRAVASRKAYRQTESEMSLTFARFYAEQAIKEGLSTEDSPQEE